MRPRNITLTLAAPCRFSLLCVAKAVISQMMELSMSASSIRMMVTLSSGSPCISYRNILCNVMEYTFLGYHLKGGCAYGI